jgi:hypothetical protein
MREVLIEAHPWLEPYIKISCEKTKGAVDSLQDVPTDPLNVQPKRDALDSFAHACTFMGWEEVDGQCDFPWARETNRTFRSERHVIADKRRDT